jgi:hypothetical protein
MPFAPSMMVPTARGAHQCVGDAGTDSGQNDVVGRRPARDAGAIRPASSVLPLAEALPMRQHRPLAAPMSGRSL